MSVHHLDTFAISYHAPQHKYINNQIMSTVVMAKDACTNLSLMLMWRNYTLLNMKKYCDMSFSQNCTACRACLVDYTPILNDGFQSCLWLQDTWTKEWNLYNDGYTLVIDSLCISHFLHPGLCLDIFLHCLFGELFTFSPHCSSWMSVHHLGCHSPWSTA